MTTAAIELNCSQRIKEIISTYPATAAVFSRYGLDACCGGGLSVSDAARAHGLDADHLCDALNAAVRGAAVVR